MGLRCRLPIGDWRLAMSMPCNCMRIENSYHYNKKTKQQKTIKKATLTLRRHLHESLHPILGWQVAGLWEGGTRGTGKFSQKWVMWHWTFVAVALLYLPATRKQSAQSIRIPANKSEINQSNQGPWWGWRGLRSCDPNLYKIYRNHSLFYRAL